MEENILNKRKNETILEYKKRLIYGKLIDKTIDYDYSTLSEYVFGRKLSEDVCRRMMYGAKEILLETDKENKSNLSDEKLLKEIEEKTLQLEKEKVKFQDQKREYKNYLRADARFEHLRDTLIEVVKENSYEPFEINFVEDKENQMVVTCSDWHIGLQEENYWNKVNIDIMKQRVQMFTNKIINLINRHNIDTVHIELLGDLVNGLIHVTTRISNEEDVISQVKIASELIANMLFNIAKNVNNVMVYGATSNHGRCVANAVDSLDVENFELLILWYLEAKLSNIKNIKFNENYYDCGMIVYQFLNETIFAVHGHQDKINTVINDLSQMLKIFPTEIHMGHYHHYYENCNHDISVVVNGTLSGTDKYAKGIRKTNKPSQNVMIYNSEGRECTYQIKF